MKVVWLVCLCCFAGCLTPVNQPPVFVSGAGPIYPEQAMRDGIEGFVVVVYDVNVAGQVENIRVLEAQPTGLFEQAAIVAVSAWRFKPPKVDGVEQAFFDVRSKVEFRHGEAAY